MKKIVFIANSSKRFRYYKLIADQMAERASVLLTILPTFALFIGAFRKAPVDEQQLLASHLKRQQINYPALYKYRWLWRFYCTLAYLTERARFAHYYAIFNKLDCEAVAIWNGQKQPYLTMVKAAEHANKRVLFFENGLMPNTTTADYAGVNAHNSLPRDPQFYLQLQQAADQLPAQLVTRAPHKKRDISKQTEIELPENYIFVPFQVPADSQIVIHSPWIESMEQMFHMLKDIHNQLRADGRSDIPTLVFKEHPSWPGNFEHLYQTDAHCIFANQNNTQQLIENAQAVITVNSTVGLESLLLGKKVVTLGNACYNIEQLVQHAANPQQLKTVLAGLAQWQYNPQLRVNFLSFLSDNYCIPGGWEQVLNQAKQGETNQQHLTAMVQRVLEQDALAQSIQAN